MAEIRVSQAADLLGVSSDTVRRWVAQNQLPAHKDGSGRTVIDGADLARWAQELAQNPTGPQDTSARNRLTGLVTDIRRDQVMAQVTLQCGPHRIVSLMSAEAVEDLGLKVGSIARAAIKSTTVVVEKE